MTKAELIGKISERAEITTREANDALNAALDTIVDEVAVNGELTIVNFGKFAAVTRHARKGRNPQTGEEIQLPERRAVKFVPGKQFKARVNG